jgi:TetR/AcrR family transcriptional regulator
LTLSDRLIRVEGHDRDHRVRNDRARPRHAPFGRPHSGPDPRRRPRPFLGATLRAIAQRAGVTQPLLHYHYRSKDELWRAAVDSLFAELRHAMAERSNGLRGVDARTAAKLRVREFITFSARHPQLHRIITQESKSDGTRMEYLVERHVRPLYLNTVELFERLTRDGLLPPIAPPHLYYILTGAGPTMFVLGPECERLSGLDPESDEVIDAHADAVCMLLFGEWSPADRDADP